MKKTVILIDGQNLFYGLKNLGILEKNIKWDKFFKSFLLPEDELIRTYWFRPQKILDSYFTSQNIKNHIVYNEYKNYYEDYRRNISNIPLNIITEINNKSIIVED